jgi:hypothetical protein
MPCRINTGRQWTARILLEEATNGNVCWFVTLTYDDDSLPTTPEGVPTLRKKRTLQWVRNQARNAGFRYYIVGEYGEKSLRPHYHLAIFPKEGWSIGNLTDAWKKGFTSAYPMSRERAGYLARYATKKLLSHTDPRLESGQEPEFRSSSRRPPLGASFVPMVVRAYDSRGGKTILKEKGDIERTVRIGGRIYPLPEYILRKVRRELGIPELHRDRLRHEGYEALHLQEEYAEWDPEMSDQIEKTLRARFKRRFHRGESKKV